MFRRHLEDSVRAALADRPVVLLHGARQVGKSTLVRTLAESERPPRRYLTLDDPAVLAAARNDPDGFLSGLEGPIAIDEVQRAPDLLRAIKVIVDASRTPGRFLLTGSANVLLLPRVSESLAGRMEVLRLWPLSQGEIEGVYEGFVDAVFGDRLPERPRRATPRFALTERLSEGGYPELVASRLTRRRDWFDSYLTTLLQRDIREFASIDVVSTLPRLLALVASRTSGILNFADLARTLGVSQTTVKRYFAVLEIAFLVRTLPAWFSNVGKRLAKSPKVLVTDVGLAAHLRGVDAQRLAGDRDALGPLLETFASMEVAKQAEWSRTRPHLHHFRTSEGHEVDLVLENAAGSLVGIEIKAAASVGEGDFRGLRLLAQVAGKRFHRGVLLHTGAEVVPFGLRLHAVPIEALWTWRRSGSG